MAAPLDYAELRQVLVRVRAPEDAIQETLLRLWTREQAGKTPDKPVAYAKRVCYRIAVRTAQRQRKMESTDEGGRMSHSPPQLARLLAREVLTALPTDIMGHGMGDFISHRQFGAWRARNAGD